MKFSVLIRYSFVKLISKQKEFVSILKVKRVKSSRLTSKVDFETGYSEPNVQDQVQNILNDEKRIEFHKMHMSYLAQAIR